MLKENIFPALYIHKTLQPQEELQYDRIFTSSKLFEFNTVHSTHCSSGKMWKTLAVCLLLLVHKSRAQGKTRPYPSRSHYDLT